MQKTVLQQAIDQIEKMKFNPIKNQVPAVKMGLTQALGVLESLIELEKQQIEDAWNDGVKTEAGYTAHTSSHQYYVTKYKDQ